MSELSEAERWYDLFDVAHSDPTAVGSLACPSCGAHSLQLIYRVYPQEAHRAMFAFWCDNCMNGLMPNSVRVPPGGICVPLAEAKIPDYTIVQD